MTDTHAVSPEMSGKRAPRSTVSVQSGLAPFVFNAWYVIAASVDVGRQLGQITVLGQPMVFYRSTTGQPVVLDDRCPHRRFSLARGHLKEDTVQCAYHGFTFDREGSCVFAPGVVNSVEFGVRSYPCAERGPWLWVWMGDESIADDAEVPSPPEVDGSWSEVSGYTFNDCNYVLVHENLLDLTHLHYLHGPRVADEKYATTPPTALESEDGSVGHTKEVSSTTIGGRGMWCGTDPGTLVDRREEIWTKGPSYHYAAHWYTRPDGSPVLPPRSIIEHAITPCTTDSTHQFWCIAQDGPLVIPVEQALDQVKGVFAEDQTVLEIQNRYIRDDTRTGVVVENSIPSDVFGLRARRLMQRLATAEQL